MKPKNKLKKIAELNNEINEIVNSYQAPDEGVQTISSDDWNKIEELRKQIGDLSKPKPIKPQWEIIDTGIELCEEFLPNSDLEYTIEFDGVNRFRALLNDSPHNKAIDWDVPKTIHYTLDKALNEFTKEEREQVLNYRGIDLDEEMFISDVFMEKSFITLVGIKVKITATTETFILLENGQTLDDLHDVGVDIYIHGIGEQGYNNKRDLGGDSVIDFI